MVRNREIINRELTAIEGKLEAMYRHVERNWPVKDFTKLITDAQGSLQNIQRNIGLSRNNDIISKEMNTIGRSFSNMLEGVEGHMPKEVLFNNIKRSQQSLESLDQAVEREPIEGYELSKPNNVN